MLTVSALKAGDSGGYYLQSLPDGPAEYYLHGVSGRWLGEGAARLGLCGPVAAVALRRVLAGADPGTGDMLVSGKAAAQGRTPGYDLTFSAPKSVSLLAALSNAEIGEVVRGAHRQAVADTMRFVEAEVAAARRGDGGARQLSAQVVAAAFEHHTSRSVDPQLHTHVVAANVAWACDGRWSAVHGQRFYGWAKTAGFVYQAALRAELTGRLGVRWGPLRNGVAEIEGFSRGQLEAFSTRRAEIKAELHRVGQSSARAAQLAAYATRDPKVDLPDDVLQGRWRARAAEVGVTAELVASITGRHLHPERPPAEEVAGHLLGPAGVTLYSSSFDRRHAVQGVAAAHRPGLAVADTVALADAVLADGRAVALAGRTKLGDARFSTVDMLATEAAVLAGARRRVGAGVAVADAESLQAALERRPSLAGEQRRMVAALTGSGAGVQCVVGVGGAGKTFALDAARDAWERSGVSVVGAALAARAAARLQAGSGIASTTVDRLLIDAERPGRGGAVPYNGVVVVDEAGIVGSRKLGRLLAVAEQCRAAVILVGDPRQLPEIEAGGAYAALTEIVPTVELRDNRRQVETWERAALAELRSGRVPAAVTAYRDRDRIHVYPDAHSCREDLVERWWAARRGGEEADMFAERRADAEDLNRRARQRLAAAGLLGADTVAAGERRFAVGDTVLALRNDRRLQVLNGTVGQVSAVDVDARTVTVQAGDATVVLPAGYLDAGHLTHGYATTIHKSQGATTGRSFSLGSDTLYREAGYVTLSRARTRSDLFIVAAPTGRSGSPIVDPLARLALDLSRSHAQHLATPEADIPAAASLAELEDEHRRLRSQIGPPPAAPVGDQRRLLDEAEAARQDAQRRLDTIAQVPRRHRREATAAAQRELGDACARQWRAHQAYTAAEADRAVHQRWVTDNTAALARYHRLGVEIEQRRQALATVALADPAAYHLDALGPPPTAGTWRHRWADAAVAIDTYRDRWHVTGPQPLGPPADGRRQARQRQAAQNTIDDTRRALRLERSLEHGMGL